MPNRCEDCGYFNCEDCGRHYCCEPCECGRSHKCGCECADHDQRMTYAD
jgi:hypothetical protein